MFLKSKRSNSTLNPLFILFTVTTKNKILYLFLKGLLYTKFSSNFYCFQTMKRNVSKTKRISVLIYLLKVTTDTHGFFVKDYIGFVFSWNFVKQWKDYQWRHNVCSLKNIKKSFLTSNHGVWTLGTKCVVLSIYVCWIFIQTFFTFSCLNHIWPFLT